MIRYITPLVVGVLVLTGTLTSVLAVAQSAEEIDYKTELNLQKTKLESEQPTAKNRRELAFVYWQLNNLPKAESVWTDLWTKSQNEWKSENPENFSNLARDLSGVYLDNGHFDEAQNTYKISLDYDKQIFGTQSAAVARDLNNLAVSGYLKAMTIQDPKQRLSKLSEALQNCNSSNELLKKLQTKTAKFNADMNYKLEVFIRRDLEKAQRDAGRS